MVRGDCGLVWLFEERGVGACEVQFQKSRDGEMSMEERRWEEYDMRSDEPRYGLDRRRSDRADDIRRCMDVA